MKKFLTSLFIAFVAMITAFSFVACTTGEDDGAKITLSATTLTMEIGEEKDLTATTEPENLELTWSSSNDAVAKYENGKVKGLSAGTATITAKNGDVSATCTVTVTEPENTDSITLSATSLTIVTGSSKSLTATTNPAEMQLTWSSDNDAVATYADGKVTGVSAGTAKIIATNGTISAECTVTVVDDIEDGINKTKVIASEVKNFVDQNFETDSGLFTIGENAQYDSQSQGIELADQGYTFIKLQMPEMTPYYDYGDRVSRSGFEGNDSYFLRFTANGNGGGIEILVVNEEFEMMTLLDAIMLSAEDSNYQVEIPKSFSENILGIVIKNPAPEDSGTTATLTSVDIVKELNPTQDRAAYYADMYTWMPALDNGFEPNALTSATGWSGWKGISFGRISNNYVAYMDGFGVALEYANMGNNEGQEITNLTFDGVQFFAKLSVPQGTKKLTYWAGHVGSPSAYRIQLYDGTNFVNLTTSSSKVNAENVATDAGWMLTSQDYASSALAEVAIPAEYVGQTVIISFAAKYNNGASYGIRFNNIRFSSEDVIVPPVMSEGVDINVLKEMTAVTGDTHSFASDAAGFTALWGAAYNNGAIEMTGTTVPEDAVANAAVVAKVELPASFQYLRITASVATGSVQVRVRMIDFESQLSTNLLDWTTVNAKTGDQMLQVQAFPTTFVGTVGLVIETKYTEQATLNLKSVVFAQAGRDAAGYDMGAMLALQAKAMPENNKFVFATAADIAEWSLFAANDTSNTFGQHNNIWLQLQGTDTTGDYTMMCAYRTTLGNFSTLEVKSGFIDGGAGANATSMIRVRALLSDGTFVNFTKDGVTDANGWFDGADKDVADYGWGGVTTNTIDVPTSLANQEVLLVVEFDTETSTEWNVLLEYLAFA